MPNSQIPKLFEKVVLILEEARSNIVKTVNSQTVLANWLIGREIVLEIQNGETRAAYGKNVLEELAQKLQSKYGKGFSVTSLKYFRSFYLAYQDCVSEIGRPMGDLLEIKPKGHPVGVEFKDQFEISKYHPTGTELQNLFSPQLTWSHYRALMRITDRKARDFYENEAIESGWDKRTLERQIHSAYFERMLKSQNPQKMIDTGRKELSTHLQPIDSLKNPYVLEFLDLPDTATIHESDLESAIIVKLQSFLLELGKGFAFVARQKQMRYEDKNFFVDLVFYNCILKCYVLIDLKIGELTHKDVGQMDSYVRMFDDLHTAEDDNPTIGLILCAEKNEAVAKYSVLSDRKQIFASKYMLYLPSEEELRQEILKEQKLIEQVNDESIEVESPVSR